VSELPAGAAESQRVRRAVLALQFPGLLDFDDPRLEWRRLGSPRVHRGGSGDDPEVATCLRIA